MPRNRRTIRTNQFSGINNVAAEEELERGELRAADNLYVTDALKIKTRPGIVKLMSGFYHSLGGRADYPLVAADKTLYKIQPDDSLVAIGSLSNDKPISYADINGTIYLSNGTDALRIVDDALEPWAVLTPNHAPKAERAEGALPPGDYRLTLTGVKAGQESAAPPPTILHVDTPQSIRLSQLPDLAGYDYANLYLTYPNGDRFCKIAELPPSTLQYSIFTNPTYGKPLETFLLHPVPASTTIGFEHGRLWAVIGQYLAYSKAMRFGLTDLSSDYFIFNQPISVFLPVETGLWVVADRCYFLQGGDPAQMQQIDKGAMTGVAGSGILIPGRDFGEGTVQNDVAMWTSDRGIMAGMPDGNLVSLTEGRFDFDIGQTGAAFLRKDGAACQYISALRSPNNGVENFGFRDRITTEVRRNGVIIN